MTIYADLSAPFDPKDIDWRPGATDRDKTKALALAYLTSRAVMDRLDEAVGPENWRDTYRAGPAGGVLCALSIRIDDEWITKEDAGENTDVEPVKGGIAEAFKRAAVKWGVGRYLYDLPNIWVDCERVGDRAVRLVGTPKLPAWALPHRASSDETAPSPAAPAQSGGAAPGASPAAGVPSYTDVEIPEWYEPFNEERKSLGIGVEALEAVLGKRPSIPNIREWLNAEDGRTPKMLLNMAADRKAS